jgi:hypothetical protein
MNDDDDEHDHEHEHEHHDGGNDLWEENLYDEDVSFMAVHALHALHRYHLALLSIDSTLVSHMIHTLASSIPVLVQDALTIAAAARTTEKRYQDHALMHHASCIMRR